MSEYYDIFSQPILPDRAAKKFYGSELEWGRDHPQQPILAYRIWLLPYQGAVNGQRYLESPFRNFIWTPRQRVTPERCRCCGSLLIRTTPSSLKLTNCMCGIYASNSPDYIRAPVMEYLRCEAENTAVGYFPRRSTKLIVHGRVWLWGQIEEGTKGYRAQYAYPESLQICAPVEAYRDESVMGTLAQDLRRMYLVDCSIDYSWRAAWTSAQSSNRFE